MEISPETGMILVGGAGMVPVVQRVLGPTADYFGQLLQGATKASFENIGRIFESAERKLGDRIEEPGAVPPRVVKYVLQEGPFCDDKLTAEYFGGVLASSRSDISRDDRGVAIMSLISRLTTYQIRTHYILYHIMKRVFDGEGVRLTISDDAERLKVFVPFGAYRASMDFSEAEKAEQIVPGTLLGLDKEDLIGRVLSFGSAEHLRSVWKEAEHAGIVFSPGALGVELFLWAYGRGDLPINRFLEMSVQFDLQAGVSLPVDCRRAC